MKKHSIVASGPFVLLITQASGAYARQDEVTPFIACPESQPGYGSVSALSPKVLSTATANSVALKKEGHVRWSEATYDGCNHLAKFKISSIAWQRNEGKGVFRCKVST